MNIIQIDNFDLDILSNFNSGRYPFLLESVVNNDNNRFSLLFAFPQYTIKSYKENDNFLAELQADIDSKKNITNTLDLPFIGGYFVYLSYEFAAKLEKNLGLNTHNMLLAQATYIPVAIIKDLKKNKTYIVDEADNNTRTTQVNQDISDALYSYCVHDDVSYVLTEDDANDFVDAVNIAKQYIREGDIFQANLSRTWNVTLSNDIADMFLYKQLKNTNPAPFAAFAKFDDFSVISSSPERLFTVANNIIQTRPIAGTRPRVIKNNDDNALKKELKNNIKEQAEHLMLLDLERNDLGRVCEYGSIKVDEMMTIESYQFVHHIVSNIQGRLRKTVNFVDIIYALFPGGTITGCPKIRSIQIIAELEKVKRGAYTGSLGYISNCGKMDFNILIRTLTKYGKEISIKAGAGIVFDSIANKELIETRCKVEGMLAIF